jgi:hypothetical protein
MAVAAQPAPLAEFQGQPARLLVAVDLSRPVRAVAARRIHRQRQADPRLLQGRDPGPGLVDYPEEKFGGFYAVTDYRDPVIQDEINANGWLIWPPIRYSYRTVNNEIPGSRARQNRPGCMTRKTALRQRYPRARRSQLHVGNWNWLGTDDQARDVLARVIYGFRISVLFGLILTARLGGHRRHRPAPCRAISAAGPTFSSSASSRSGRRFRSSTSS